MPLPKGAKLNPKSGRFEMPTGYRKKKDEERAKERKPTTSSRRIEDNFHKSRTVARNTFVYSLYAVYAGSKPWVGYVEEPTAEWIAQHYGGGRYEVWKIDRTTNEPIGEPAIFDIDRQQFPPLLEGFKQGLVPRQATGFGVMPQPGAWPGFGAAGQGPTNVDKAKLEELEEEIGDLEDEVSSLKRRLEDKEREISDLKNEHARQLDKLEQDRRFEALMLKMTGDKKDPLEQFLSFKRVDAELAGPFKGPQDPMQVMQTQMAMFTQFQSMVEKLGGKGEDGGGVDVLMKVLGNLSEAAAKAPAKSIELPAAPVAKGPETVVTKSPEQEVAEQQAIELSRLELTALLQVAEVCEDFFSIGMPEPQAIADFILTEKSKAFDLFRETVKLDDPENAIEVIGQHRPKAVDSEEKKRTIAQAFALAQAKLIEG